MSTHERNPMGDAAVSGFASFADKYEKSTGGVTREIAHKLMSMSSPFTSHSRILDNATGTGIVVEEIQKHILSTNANANIRVPIIAADAAQPMIDNLNVKLEHRESVTADNGPWPNLQPVTTHAVPAEQLNENVVPSNTITHAYMNFGLFFCTDPILAASHIYRCLASGGQAFITTWHDLGYMVPVEQTYHELYPDEPHIKMPFSEQWKDPAYVRELMVKAGFEEGKIRISLTEAYMRHADIQEMAATKAQLFTALIKGPEGWESEEVRRKFVNKLAENLLACKDFSDAGGDGVRLRMIANIAVCAK